MNNMRWDKYCQRGEKCCLDQNCACINSLTYRYRNARARKLSILKSIIYGLIGKSL